MLEVLLEGDGFTWTSGHSPSFHPFRQGEVLLHGKPVAVYGEVHPEVARNFRISGRVYAAEVDLELLAEHDPGLARYQEISRFPRIDRDLAVLIAREQPVAELLQAISEEGGEFLQEAAVFDVYQGKQSQRTKRALPSPEVPGQPHPERGRSECHHREDCGQPAPFWCRDPVIEGYCWGRGETRNVKQDWRDVCVGPCPDPRRRTSDQR